MPIILGVGAGVGFLLLAGAWGRWFILVRFWLCLRRQVPWRVGTFLEDAHRRGALRQSGAVYQFRHVRIQHHLAARTTNFGASVWGSNEPVDPVWRLIGRILPGKQNKAAAWPVL